MLFQPTHPHGVRHLQQFCPLHFWDTFQPTHPHGVRPSSADIACPHTRFNPRTRTGCDEQLGTTIKQGAGFNPRTRTGCDGRTCRLA